MKIIVTDRESIERGIIVRSSYVVISIRDPEKPKAKVKKQSGLRDVLYLAFHDAEPAAGTILPSSIVLMTPAQAADIWKFVEKWQNNVGTVVVHCEQGMSRSPAVAVAIAPFKDYSVQFVQRSRVQSAETSSLTKAFQWSPSQIIRSRANLALGSESNIQVLAWTDFDFFY